METNVEPEWAYLKFPEIDYQDIIYYSAPKSQKKLKDLSEVDPELLKTFEKLGISLNEQKRLANVAIDAVFDSVSIATTFQEELVNLELFLLQFQKPFMIIQI
jgi:Fe-S cluster assembly protein SufB